MQEYSCRNIIFFFVISNLNWWIPLKIKLRETIPIIWLYGASSHGAWRGGTILQFCSSSRLSVPISKVVWSPLENASSPDHGNVAKLDVHHSFICRLRLTGALTLIYLFFLLFLCASLLNCKYINVFDRFGTTVQ